MASIDNLSEVDLPESVDCVVTSHGVIQINDMLVAKLVLRVESEGPLCGLPTEHATWLCDAHTGEVQQARDGDGIAQAIRNLVNVIDWDGTLESINDGEAYVGKKATLASLYIEQSDNGKKYLRGKYLNNIGGISLKRVDADSISAISASFKAGMVAWLSSPPKEATKTTPAEGKGGVDQRVNALWAKFGPAYNKEAGSTELPDVVAQKFVAMCNDIVGHASRKQMTLEQIKALEDGMHEWIKSDLIPF